MAESHAIAITVADVLVEMSSSLSAEELGIVDRLGPFFGAPEQAADRASLTWAESEQNPVARGELIYNPGPVLQIRRDKEYCYASLSYSLDSPRDPIRGVLRANAAWDELTLTERRSGARWRSLLNIGASELLFRTRILFSGGLVFHASGLDDNGRGVVFVGHAGAGKSTQLGLWSDEAGVRTMNDDRIAVRANGDSAQCYGTPWGGTADIRNNHSAPLSVLLLLEQGPENRIERLSPSAAAPLLSVRSFLPYWDRELMKRALVNLNAITRRVPVYRLSCRPEKSVIPLVRSVL